VNTLSSKSIGGIVIDFEKGGTDDSAYFEAHDSNLNGADYTVRLYPASILGNCELAVTAGRIDSGGGGAGLIKDERITLDGKANYKPRYNASSISSKSTGLYFDENDNRISPPAISVANGEITINPPCFGLLVVNYYTPYALLNYTAQVNSLGGMTLGRTYGTIFAFKDKKVLASFEVPNPSDEGKDRFDAITVYSELVLDPETGKRHERPTDFPTSNDYAQYPAAPEDSKPGIDAYTITKRVHERVFVELDRIYQDTAVVSWELPTVGNPFLGVVYKLDLNIPTDSSKSCSQSTIDKLNSETLIQIKNKYGIA